MSSGAAPRPRALPSLTSLRWFAALAVFGCHVGGNFDITVRWLLPGGAVGVGFFFVLSGFVLTWSHPDEVEVRSFWVKRFARIYPATLASTLVALGLWSAGVPYLFVTPGGVAACVTLTQSWFPGFHPVNDCNGVTWSLCCEAFFYLLFPMLIGWARRRPTQTVALVTFGAVIVAAVFTAVVSLLGVFVYTYYLPIVRLPEFLTGIALALAMQRGWKPPFSRRTAALVLAVGWLVVTGLPLGAAPQLRVYYCLPGAAAVIAASAYHDVTSERGWLRQRWLVYLGELSFAFYLMHLLALDVAHQHLSHSGVLAWASVAFVVAFASAVVLHHGVELPIQRFIVQAARRRRTRAETKPAERTTQQPSRP